MRRALLPALVALLAQPAAAAAQEPAFVPPFDYAGPAATISRGAPLTFAVRTPAPAGSVIVRVSGSDETDEYGLLTGDDGTWLDEPATPAGDGLQVWTVPADSVLRQRPGRYYWQAYLTDDVAETALEPVGPVRELIVTLPAADRGRGKLYPRYGRRGSTRFYLSAADIPSYIDERRFQTVMKKAAQRWGMKALRWTSARAGKRDGWNVAGFSSKVPSGVLGVQTDYVIGGRVVEQDLALRKGENWAPGPDYPALDEIDLESVIIHELGHMAGNKRHRAGCSNSPMVVSLGQGEWWRGARDKWFGDCGARAASARKTFIHRVVRID
jgi:hypothetical protein